MSELNAESEKNLALSWFEGVYSQLDAETSARLRKIKFDNVIEEYAKLYEDMEKRSANQWN